jgi:hypothetical protein
VGQVTVVSFAHFGLHGLKNYNMILGKYGPADIFIFGIDLYNFSAAIGNFSSHQNENMFLKQPYSLSNDD